MLLIHFIIFSYILQFVQAVFFLPPSTKLQFDRFDAMCRGKNVPIRTRFVELSNEKNVYYFNVTTNVTEDIEGELTEYLKIIRCRVKENLDTCEEFLKPSPLDYCRSLRSNQKNINPFFIDYSPPLKCPIKKGIYRAYNHKLDIAPVVVFPLGDWYWRTNVEPPSTKLHFDRFDGTCRGKNVPIRTRFVELVGLSNEKSIYHFNISTNVTENIAGQLMLHMKIIRCRFKESLDTCEEFLKPSPVDYCRSLRSNQKNINPFFIDYSPRFMCPIKKGSYHASNFKLDIASLAVFPLTDWYRRTTAEVRDETTKRILSSMQVDAHLVKLHK